MPEPKRNDKHKLITTTNIMERHGNRVTEMYLWLRSITIRHQEAGLLQRRM